MVKLSPLVVRSGLRVLRPLLTSSRLSLASKRRVLDLATGLIGLPRGSAAESGQLAGVAVEWITPPNSRPGAAMLFLHGGGYTLGSATGYRGFAGTLAAAAGMQVAVVDYRRAPEHPFPAALEDALAAYGELTKRAAMVVVAGDSAGGGLALALAQQLRESKQPAPVALGLICPWLDLAADRDGLRPPAKDPALVPSALTEWSKFYAGRSEARDPQVSPIYGDLTSLPPIVMHSASDDPLASDADKLEAAIAVQASDSVLIHRRFSKRWHDFHLQLAYLADARDAVSQLGALLPAFVESKEPAQKGS
ncbi:MAG: alpha/beta hydrolase fold domain-containing protein [Mycolicibacter algericus]|uniref:alpha/beta hydrolase fold domain-containing protein n=1 Tax=Mycolicibacter algericus TaxID=1288388 RepID=UPI003C71A8F0